MKYVNSWFECKACDHKLKIRFRKPTSISTTRIKAECEECWTEYDLYFKTKRGPDRKDIDLEARYKLPAGHKRLLENV